MLSHNQSQNRTRKMWTLLVGLITISLLLSGCGSAAATPKVYRVGIIASQASFLKIADGFKAKLTELGYVEGKNVVYDQQTVGAPTPTAQPFVRLEKLRS